MSQFRSTIKELLLVETWRPPLVIPPLQVELPNPLQKGLGDLVSREDQLAAARSVREPSGIDYASETWREPMRKAWREIMAPVATGSQLEDPEA